MEFLKLAISFLKIGAVSFGGGWTIVGVIRNEVVNSGWITADEFPDVIAIAQVTPGPIALNTATLAGYRIGGIPGAILATLSVVTVPMLLIALTALFAKFIPVKRDLVIGALKTPTIAMMAMTLVTLSLSLEPAPFPVGITILAFAVTAFTKINPLAVILGSGAVNALVETLKPFFTL